MSPMLVQFREGCSSDDQVMAGVQAGSVTAFGVLHDRYRGRAYRVARSICRDDGRAQESVQEAFMSIWSMAGNYHEDRGLAPWLLTVVRNRAIDNARRNAPHAVRRASDAWLTDVAAPGDVAEQIVAADVADRLSALVARLPDEQHEVMVLAFYGQLTHTEIAARLQLPLGTVKGRIRLAITRLRGDIAHVP